jgi:Beta-galactosidase
MNIFASSPMKFRLYNFIVATFLSVFLQAEEPLTKIQDLLKPHRVLQDFTVSTSPGITQAKSTTGMLDVSGALKNKYGTLIFRPTEGKWDLSEYSYFRVDITNNGEGLIWILGRLDNEGAVDWANSSSTMAYILPGERATLGFPFQRTGSVDDSPEIFRQQSGRPNGFRGHWLPFYPEKVIECRMTIQSTIDMLNLKDIQVSLAQPYGATANARLLELPYLDKFGQVRQLDWPKKLSSENELLTRAKNEEREAKTDNGPKSFDRFGGWKDGPKLKATGFFRTEKYKGRWWFVDPDGKLFFSHGANSVGFGQSTPITNRKQLFEWLPSATDMGEALQKDRVNFMNANLHRTFGAEWKPNAYERLNTRLRRFGMNTVGAWSENALLENAKTPYTHILYVGRWPAPLGYNMVDPFSPKFEQSVENGLRKLFPKGEDPMCIGVFIDNELGWYEEFVHSALAGPVDMPARKAVFEFLKKKYISIQRLNTAWATKYQSWDDLKTFPPTSDGFALDLKELKRMIASRYYRGCRDMMRKVVPQHLYLGSRIHKASPEIYEEATRYSDVLSVNRYMSLPVTLLPKGFDKPCLISEFHFGAPDRGVPGVGLQCVGDQMARSRSYAAYVLDAVLQPNIIGAHWFAYADQSAAGRPGENYQVGFVDVTDRVYPEIATTSRGLAEIMYSLADQENVKLLPLLEKVWKSQ